MKIRMAGDKTFENEETLPSLPVPTLEQTVSKYLESCEPLMDAEALEDAREACDEFLASPVTKQLQEKLLERAKGSKNWLEHWWLDKAYLETRMPLPLLNYSGPAPYVEGLWPLEEGTQLERSAWNLYFFYCLWDTVRKEEMEVHRTSRGAPLSMNQFRYIFNTYRRPRQGCDELLHFFNTEREGPLGPTHAIVMKKGRVFRVDGYCRRSNAIRSPHELMAALEHIDAECARLPPGPSVGVLTTLERDRWTATRQHLVAASAGNAACIDAIEKSLFVLCLDETSPCSYTEICRAASYGNWANRWYDKSFTSISFRNGAFASNCDHSPCDAMVMAVLSEFNIKMAAKHRGVRLASAAVDAPERPRELCFDLDDHLRAEIAAAKENAAGIERNVDAVMPVFQAFGKQRCKELRLHPDFCVQISLQLTYMQLYGEPAATYETAMTRRFYHGRTETCRTCTSEAASFCRALLVDRTDAIQLKAMLERAQKKYLWLMTECMENRGCDRHLFGLAVTAAEEKLPLPALFSHRSYAATGGAGNFVLSTSCLGYSVIQGIVAPMVERGYGVFYRINDERIIFGVSSYRSCAATNSQRFADHLRYNLSRVAEVMAFKRGNL